MIYGEYPFLDDDAWEKEYAHHLEQQMERQYWDDMETQYEEALEAARQQQPLDPSEYNTTDPDPHSDNPAHNLLHLPLGDNDANAATVGEYLGLLLSTLWLQQEGFSGKRPFGNSDWTTPVYLAMGKAGLTTFTLDEDGYIEDFDADEEVAADEQILQAIRFAYYHG